MLAFIAKLAFMFGAKHITLCVRLNVKKLRDINMLCPNTVKSSLLAMLALFALIPSAFADSEVRLDAAPSELLDREFVFNIYLPDGYTESDADYPVLYLLHGNRGTENSWMRGADLQAQADALIASGDIKPLLIVTPADPRYWWADGYDEPVLTAFVEDLLPYVESQYRAETSRAGRAIGGYSAGGFGAVNIALQYPQLFAAAAPLSPAVYTPQPPADSSATEQDTFLVDGEFDRDRWASLNWVSFIGDYQRSGIIVPFYINTGDHDRFDIAYHAAVFYQALREHQPELVEFRVFDGDHDFDAWGGSIADAMIYMDQFIMPAE